MTNTILEVLKLRWLCKMQYEIIAKLSTKGRRRLLTDSEIEEAKHLRFVEKWTLQRIADKFCISRSAAKDVVSDWKAKRAFREKKKRIGEII